MNEYDIIMKLYRTTQYQQLEIEYLQTKNDMLVALVLIMIFLNLFLWLHQYIPLADQVSKVWRAIVQTVLPIWTKLPIPIRTNVEKHIVWVFLLLCLLCLVAYQ